MKKNERSFSICGHLRHLRFLSDFFEPQMNADVGSAIVQPKNIEAVHPLKLHAILSGLIRAHPCNPWFNPAYLLCTHFIRVHLWRYFSSPCPPCLRGESSSPRA